MADQLEAMTAAPDHHERLLENERVRVLDTRVAPGERTPVHAHAWPAALYVMSWSDFIRRDANGEVMVDSRDWEKQPAVGESLWIQPLPPHSIENVGTSELRLIAIELKG
jgi:mannose-6-phosphate isomerase-like protein (cupin superfamily)